MENRGERAVSEWRALWSDTYGRAQPGGAAEPGLNLAGWISSYTGRPIAEREMREWIDRTVERILALRPRRLLEIGCGMGLLLTRLAPACEECWGLDFSPEAVAHVERTFAGRGAAVTVLQREADDLSGLPPGCFDTVVLNSVVQYFPDLSYLRRVLAGIAALAAPGARIFLGDLRSLPLLESFHLSVLLQQAESETPLAEVREQLASRVSRERELAIDPGFFSTLGNLGVSGLAGIEIELKRGRARNELTRFRYDVTLTLAGGEGSGQAGDRGVAPERWLDWRGEGLTLASLRSLLAGGDAPRSLGLRGVPNARLAVEVAAVSLLHGDPGDGFCDRGDRGLTTVADLQAALSRRPPPAASGIEPEELWSLSRGLPYRVAIHWGERPETLDVVLLPLEELVSKRPVV